MWIERPCHHELTVLQGNCREVEGVIVAQVDALVEALQARRVDLINWVRRQRDAKVGIWGT